MKKVNFSVENITLFLIGLSFFIGIWHAFPMLNVVNDEMYYVGGVFRALEHHTIIPLANDVPYGTITYLCNYVFILITLPIYFLFSGFSVLGLKLFLIQKPEFAYLTLRFMSSILSVVLLYFVNKLLKREIEEVKTRLLLLVLLFTNIITGTILHTGKMWVMSVLLVVISFYYLNESINQISEENKAKNIFLTILFAFLALCNLPLNFYSLVNIPILLFVYRNDKKTIFKIIKYVFVGLVVYILLTLFNFEGIKNQILSIFTEYHPLNIENTSNLSFLGSLFVYVEKTIALFLPTVLVLLFAIKNKIRNKKLFYISMIYFVVYISIIAFVANWTSDLRSSLRYLFPIGFFLIFILSSMNLKFNKLGGLIGAFSVLNYIFLLYFLSVPTTYNQAYKWVNNNLSTRDAVIFNNVTELQLVKNKQSSLLTQDSFCSSKCKYIISLDLNKEFKPLVIDSISHPYEKIVKNAYYIYDHATTSKDYLFVTSFTNNSEYYHSVDYNIGNYFDLSFYNIGRLGRNIYIYKI